MCSWCVLGGVLRIDGMLVGLGLWVRLGCLFNECLIVYLHVRLCGGYVARSVLACEVMWWGVR